MDESGTPPKVGQDRPAYFVVGGLIVPEGSWAALRDGLNGLKIRLKLRGELKWRYFSPDNDDSCNPMRHRTPEERNGIRAELYRLICNHRSVKTVACVVSAKAAYAMESVNDQADIYHLAYKGVTERFQYHLQDVSRETGSRQQGIVICDHRGANDDRMLRQVHQKLLHSNGEFISNYKNFVEGLFLTPSHMSVGVQLADLVAGAIWRKFERADDTWFQHIEPSLRQGPQGQTLGYGIVKSPKRGWE